MGEKTTKEVQDQSDHALPLTVRREQGTVGEIPFPGLVRVGNLPGKTGIMQLKRSGEAWQVTGWYTKWQLPAAMAVHTGIPPIPAVDHSGPCRCAAHDERLGIHG